MLEFLSIGGILTMIIFFMISMGVHGYISGYLRVAILPYGESSEISRKKVILVIYIIHVTILGILIYTHPHMTLFEKSGMFILFLWSIYPFVGLPGSITDAKAADYKWLTQYVWPQRLVPIIPFVWMPFILWRYESAVTSILVPLIMWMILQFVTITHNHILDDKGFHDWANRTSKVTWPLWRYYNAARLGITAGAIALFFTMGTDV